MSDEQPDGETSKSAASEWLNSALKVETEETAQPQVRRATKAIPPDPPVVVVQRHMNQMTHAQRGAVRQLIEEIAQLQVELARAKGVNGDQEAETSDKNNGVDHVLVFTSQWLCKHEETSKKRRRSGAAVK